jgi:hypothetical protein
MKNIKLAFGALFFFALALLPKSKIVLARTVDSSAQIRSKATASQEIIDSRFLLLTSYLRSKNSPLVDYSWEFIKAADKYQIDWRLLPGIVGLESYFGRRMVPDTYNGYGWAGGYYSFSSWEESIDYVSSKLRDNYYNRGLTSPELIGPVYAPPNPNWGGLVLSIMNKISPEKI